MLTRLTVVIFTEHVVYEYSIMLYIWNQYHVVCQLYLQKNGQKNCFKELIFLWATWEWKQRQEEGMVGEWEWAGTHYFPLTSPFSVISFFCLCLFFFDWEGYISWGRKWGRGRESESEVAQSCPTLCDSINISPPGSSVHGIFLARVLEWGAIAFSIYNHYLTLNPVATKHMPHAQHVCKLLWIKRLN